MHRPAAIGREAVAVEPDHVDVAGAQRQPFLEDFGTLVDQRIKTALENFAVVDRPPRNAELGSRREDQGLDRVIGLRRALALFVAVPAGAGLLAEPSLLAQTVGD